MYLKCLVQCLAHSKSLVNVNHYYYYYFISWVAVQPVSSKRGREEVLRIGVVGKGLLEEVRLELDFRGREERKGIRKVGGKKHFKRSRHGSQYRRDSTQMWF